MPWMNIKCQCGHESDIDTFCRTTLFGSLPAGHYQCPGCGHAWTRKESEHRILRHGSAATIIPGRVELLTIEARL